jgi:hypothetical protein
MLPLHHYSDRTTGTLAYEALGIERYLRSPAPVLLAVSGVRFTLRLTWMNSLLAFTCAP